MCWFSRFELTNDRDIRTHPLIEMLTHLKIQRTYDHDCTSQSHLNSHKTPKFPLLLISTKRLVDLKVMLGGSFCLHGSQI